MYSWMPPEHVRMRKELENVEIRRSHHVIVDGEDIPPPIESFAVMSFFYFYRLYFVRK